MNDTENKEKNSLEFPSKNNHLPNADKDSKDLPHGKMHIHSAEEMRPYIEDAESVKRSSSDIVKDERRIFGHFHNSSLPADAHNPKGISSMTNEECDYCGKELDQCHCDLLDKNLSKLEHHLNGLDCMECAAIIEGKIRQLPLILYAAVCFRDKDLYLIAKAPEDIIYPQLEKVCASVDENIKIMRHSNPGKTSYKTKTYEMPTLDCAACALKLEKLINKQPDVISASISYATKTLKLTAEDPDSLIPELTEKCKEIESPTVIQKPHAKLEENSSHGILDWIKQDKVQLGIGGIIFGAGMILNYNLINLPVPQGIIDILFVISYIILGGEVLLNAVKNIMHGEFFDETFLMSIATLGAFAIHEFPEAVGVMFFYRIGEYFMDLATDQSREQIMEAVDLRPQMVNLISSENNVTEIPAEDAKVGDYLLIRPGDRIPLDGIVVKGDSQIDTSAITGESVPVTVHVGDSLDSGCINMTETVVLKVEKILSESMVSKILNSVENAVANKPKLDKFITRFSKVYTPIVVVIALITAVVPPLLFNHPWYPYIYTALTFLVISCPCAIVISIPLSFFSGIGAASREGILFKGGTSIESLSTVKVAALDKTGTVTEGSFKVRKVLTVPDISRNELLSLAASAESYSTHPIARSIVTATDLDENPLDQVDSIQEISGSGIIASIKGDKVYVGNHLLLETSGIDIPSKFSTLETAGPEIFIAKNNKFLGRIVVSDELKEDAKEGIRELKDLGITPVMLTGDNKEASQFMADKAGISEVYAQLKPTDKFEIMKTLRAKFGPVLYVGDGINDAPVLAGSDVGAAMGSGSDSAIEAADLVFLNSSVEAIPKSVKIARKVLRTAKENITFAILVKVLVLVMGLLGYANMWFAVFADTGVTIICVLYSIRLLKIKF